MAVRIVDVTEAESFSLVPPCADPSFDHRTCDYWEDADRGSKASRPSWLEASTPAIAATAASHARSAPANPFATDDVDDSPNPFAPNRSESAFNPFASMDDDPLADNPFAPSRPARSTVGADAPRKLTLLGRGLGVFGSYAKILLDAEEPAAYAQFGPLSAFPRAQRLRELYPQLPEASPLSRPTRSATPRRTRRAPPRRSSGSMPGSGSPSTTSATPSPGASWPDRWPRSRRSATSARSAAR
jgi:hypothetical protein